MPESAPVAFWKEGNKRGENVLPPLLFHCLDDDDDFSHARIFKKETEIIALPRTDLGSFSFNKIKVYFVHFEGFLIQDTDLFEQR